MFTWLWAVASQEGAGTKRRPGHNEAFMSDSRWKALDLLSNDSRWKALDLFRLARETERSELRNHLLALAQVWLNLADHEQKVHQLEADTERLLNTEASSRPNSDH